MGWLYSDEVLKVKYLLAKFQIINMMVLIHKVVCKELTYPLPLPAKVFKQASAAMTKPIYQIVSQSVTLFPA